MAAPSPNLFGLHQYDGLSNFFSDQSFGYDGFVLPPAAGWIVIVLFGFVFALLAIFLVWVDIKFAGIVYNSEQFNTAGRSIGTGLLAVDVVSHWTWASILLQSTSYGWFYGATGAYWYAVSGAVMVLLFAVVALELKHRAPKAHTMLEVVYTRWGRGAHIVFFFFAILTNLLVSLSMLQGCVAAVNALTGVNPYAMAFLIPIGVVFYAAIGGLKSTFTTSYVHTVVVYVVCCIFMFKTFMPNGLVGGIDDVYNRLLVMSQNFPVTDQRSGSYMTGWSNTGLQFQWIGMFTSSAQMVVDQSYWQTAIAGKASSAAKGYFLASYLYMSITFVLPLSAGVIALALDLPVSVDEAFEGLVLPASAYVVMGKSGAVLVIIICFMAVTSSGASEMLAVSSLYTFDFYRRYINPKADGKRLVMVSRIAVCVWSIIMGIIMCIAQAANINVDWLILIIGIFCGGAVWPLISVIFWDRATGKAAISAAIIGSASGITAWMVSTDLTQGSVSIVNSEANPPLISGSVISNVLSLVLLVSISLAFPEGKFDWNIYKERITSADEEVVKGGHLTASKEEEADAADIASVRVRVWIGAAVLTILGMIVWPCLTLPAGTPFSLGYFKFYVILGFIFILSSTVIGTVLPLWEGRHMFAKVLTGNTFQEWADKSFRGGSRKGLSTNGAGTTAKEVELNDSAHGPTVTK